MEEYLKNVNSSIEYYTVSEYSLFLEKEHGIKRPRSKERLIFYQAAESECTRICKEFDIQIENEPNEEFGSLNKYPEYILAEVILSKHV
jgi:hypothetical protein